VWQEPETPISNAWLGAQPDAPRDLTCRFRLTALGGTTPKFDCVLADGERIRIKYGTGPEIPAEAATTRLLRALGFGADTVMLVERLTCLGCPAEPFVTIRTVNATRTTPIYENVIDYEQSREFAWVGLERKLEARPIETDVTEGWGFFELDKIDPQKGGAPRSHVDALRLLAAFLAHWDNKSENQRLVCLSREWDGTSPCPRPFMLIQDAGATFGPRKVDLANWEAAPIWEDRAQCTVSLSRLPYDGGTFGRVVIGEGGRTMLGRLLTQLREPQLAELFAGARFDKRHGIFGGGHSVAEWVRVFKARVTTITEGPRCPQA
jgi:hypothetical protein